MTVLKVTGLNSSPWGEPLLQDINMCLPAGTILGVVGPNGAGKSSLLHTIAGEVSSYSGSIELASTPLHDWDRMLRARSLALLPQASTLAFPFLVEEVVQLGRTPHSTGNKIDNAIVAEVMAAADILDLRHRLYTQLSGGERQRVHLARVLAQIWRPQEGQPRLLLLDEPTSALDLSHSGQLIECVRQLSSRGCAVIIVLHDFNLLSSLVDQILVLKDGRAAALGTPEETLTTGIFEEVFGVNVTIGEHPHSGKPLVLPMPGKTNVKSAIYPDEYHLRIP